MNTSTMTGQGNPSSSSTTKMSPSSGREASLRSIHEHESAETFTQNNDYRKYVSRTTKFGGYEQAQREALSNLERSSRPVPPSGFRVSGLETWTGKVVEIEAGGFTAELQPSEQGPRVLADFDRELLSADDELTLGDVIYVTVRTVRGRGGYNNRTSSVRLRRLGNWTIEEIESQRSRVAARVAALEGLVG